MGMSAQGNQGGVQNNGANVFYDSETGQYYTNQPAPIETNVSSPMGMMGMGIFNQPSSSKGATERNYITDYVSPASKPSLQHNYINIAALFPELYQAAQGMQGDSQASAGLLGGQGAAQSSSSGAGRFM